MSHLTLDTEDIDILIDRLTALAIKLTEEQPRLHAEATAIRRAKQAIRERLARVSCILKADNPEPLEP